MTGPDPWRDERLVPYLYAMQERERFVDMLGLPHLGDRTDVRLNALFVHPYAGTEVPTNAEESRVREGAALAVDRLGALRRMVLLGEPGAGKSTLVQSIAYDLVMAGESPARRALGPVVPLLIRFRERPVRDVLVKGGGFVEAALAALLADQEVPPWREGARAALEECLAQGHAAVLLDGWDEAPEPLREAVRGQLAGLPTARDEGPIVLLTSRPVGWAESPLQPRKKGADLELADRAAADTAPGMFPVEHLRPFRKEQIALFVERWFEWRVGDLGQRSQRVAGLMTALAHGDARLTPLARIPNLLALMCLVYRVHAELPHERTRLYDKMAEAYLESIDKARGLSTPVPWERAAGWLGALARRMQRDRVRATTRRKSGGADPGAVLIAKEQALAVLVEAGADPSFLDNACSRGSVLLPRSENTVAFAHLAFQEYFAARSLVGAVRATWRQPKRADPWKELRDQAFSETGLEVGVLALELFDREPGGAAAALEHLRRPGKSDDDEGWWRLVHAADGDLAIDVPAELVEELERWLAGVATRQKSIPVWVDDLAFIRFAPDLQILYALTSRIADLRPLQACTQLRRLGIPFAPVVDLEPLAACRALTHLFIESTAVRRLAPLAGMERLQILDVDDCDIEDLPVVLTLADDCLIILPWGDPQSVRDLRANPSLLRPPDDWGSADAR